MTGRLTHAGGIVHRNGQILLVRARPAPHDWVLPKGHIEPGESSEDTAIREVAEEAGVVASVVEPLGVLEFTKPNGTPARVRVFLMQYVRDVAAAEEREVRWWTFDAALATIPFENTRELLVAARRALARG